MPCLGLEGLGGWLGTRALSLWEQGLGVAWAGVQQLLVPGPETALSMLMVFAL